MTDARQRKTEVRGQMSEVGSRNTEHGAKSIADGVKTKDDRRQKTDFGSWNALVEMTDFEFWLHRCLSGACVPNFQ